jgi:formylmethanofuran dehydrogenase subunit C
VSEIVMLTLRTALDASLEVDGVTADRLARLTEREIAALRVWSGAHAGQLGDFFVVKGERAARVRVEGAVARVDGLASGMAGGELVIDGDAGRRVGADMTGGSVEVLGSVGAEAGLAMSGGVLRIIGSAGDRLGAARPGASRGMTGGEIIVSGSAGADTAARARRGLVVVAGHVGHEAAREMVAGTLIVLGNTLGEAGRGSKRGTIVAVGEISVPATYRYACTYEPPHLRLTLTYLRRRFGLVIADRVVDGRFRRYCGDAGDPGRGEILEWMAK